MGYSHFSHLISFLCKDFKLSIEATNQQTWQIRGNSVQFSCSVVSDFFAIPWTAAWQASMSIINTWSFLKLMCIKSVMPSNHLILCRPLLLLPSIMASIRVFAMSQFFCEVAKVLELQLQHQSFQLIFRTDFLQDWLVWSPCSPRDSQDSSPIP